MFGPLSQSLGIGLVDTSGMRRPLRRKELIITWRHLIRVIISASTIIFDTLYIYLFPQNTVSTIHWNRTVVSNSSQTLRTLDSQLSVDSQHIYCVT